MEKTFLSIIAIGTIVLASCGGADTQKLKDENAQLRHERDSLLALMDGPTISLAPMDTAALRAGILALKNAQTIEIPSSLKFERDTLEAILKITSQGKQTKGVMAYPILAGGVVKMALVPYYEPNPSAPTHYQLSELKAYDYSQFCPNVCATNASSFGAENVFRTFKKP